MSLFQRFCQVVGHEMFQSTHICTFKECDQYSRWVCVECSFELLHSHGQQQNTHIMNQQEFQEFINSIDYQQIQNEQKQLQYYLEQLSHIFQQMSELQQYLEIQIKDLDYQVINEIRYLVDHEFYNIGQLQITKTLQQQNREDIQIIEQKFFNNIQTIMRQLDDLKQKIIETQIENVKQSNFQYVQYIQQSEKRSILTAQISQNQQYLAFGGYDEFLNVYDIRQNQRIQLIKLDYIINVCQFSENSKLLYVGCFNGFVFCFDLQNYCIQNGNQKIHEELIIDIIEQQNFIIITCSGKNIIITDLKNEKQLLNIKNAQYSSVYGLDYDRINDVIISGSSNKSIQLYHGKSGEVIIQKLSAHSTYIFQVEMVDGSKLLSADNNYTLKLWSIDYKTRNLIFLNQIKDQNDIKNFRLMKNNQILLICRKYVKVLDLELKQVMEIKHPQGDNVKIYNQVKQLRSLNYIIILGSCQITVIKYQKVLE